MATRKPLVLISGVVQELPTADVLPTLTFGSIAVSGQNSVVADAVSDVLTLIAGSNVTITTNETTDSITLSATGATGTLVSVTNAVPTGIINGSNTVFTIAGEALNNEIIVTLNGLKQKETTDYSLSGTTLTFVVAPFTGAVLEVFYVNTGSSALDMFNGSSVAREPSGWNDILGEINIKGSGAQDPTWATIRDGLNGYRFSATAINEVQTQFHIGHDYKPGGSVLLHVHWLTTGTNTGICRWGFEYSIAKGYNQGADSVFPASTIVYVEEAGVATAYVHHVSEISASVTLTNVEPDSLILCRVFRDANHVNDTLTDPAFLLKVDAHYETDRVATLNRNVSGGSFYV